ncbi:uncharacterized protein V1518DRAFT_373999 [Limtongia smithiae]|uniref:uncharacterized protein n=1 Tax=Limtongia smithiae TaxID=1125753 RepID=UPI0034CF7F07
MLLWAGPLLRSPPLLTLVASLLSVAASCAIPYSRYLFSASFSWAAFGLFTLLPLDRFLRSAVDPRQTYRRIDVVICATCIVLSTVCASLLGERGTGLASVLIPLLVHVLRFQYMDVAAGAPQHEKHLRQLQEGTNDIPVLLFITLTSFLALAPKYSGAAQLVFGMCSSIFAATYLSISDLTIPLTRPVLREISAYTAFGLALMSLLLDGWAGWAVLSSADGTTVAYMLWPLLSSVKNLIIMILIQQLSPINASFVDLIGNLSTALYTHSATWKVTAMCVSYMAIASTLLPPHMAEIRVKYVAIRLSRFITLVISLFLLGFGIVTALTPRTSGSSQRVAMSSTASTASSSTSSSSTQSGWNTTIHPISYLMQSHLTRFEQLVSKQTSTYPEAVKEYRRRYNVNPPPNFDKWHAFATERKSVIFDDYDSIFASMRPFWALPPHVLRESVRDVLRNPDSYLLGVHIRNGHIADVTGGRSAASGHGSTSTSNLQWYEVALCEMISEFVRFLPDMDIAFNLLDAPRVILPRADLSALVDDRPPLVSGTRNSFSGIPANELELATSNAPVTYISNFNSFAHQSSWGHAKLSCPVDSPVKQPGAYTGDGDRVGFSNYGLSIGFLKNVTAATDICLEPALQHEHGFFVRPETFNIITEPVPIFSAAKMSTFNDILFPSPAYYAERAAVDDTRDPQWAEKSATLYWRGSSVGLRSRGGAWRLGHRQRTLAYFNKFEENCTMLVDLGELEEHLANGAEKKAVHAAGGKSGETSPEAYEIPSLDGTGVEGKVEGKVGKKVKRDDMLDMLTDDDSSAAPAAEHFLAVGAQQDSARARARTDATFVEHVVPKLPYKEHVDARFSALTQCDDDADCAAQFAFFGPPDVSMPKTSFQDTWQHKFLLDLDGNAYSVRYYAFLRSRSLVVKQTLFREWHDERLVPWVHYVPLSLDLKEGFESLRFYLENDVSAKFVADQSRKWARKVLRKEDMSIYFFRLLLEYARVVDDDRDNVGCV